MLRRIAFVVRKEIKFFWLDWESYLWAFAMPVLFMYFFGTVTGQFSGSGSVGMKDVMGVVAPDSGGFLAEQIVQRLEQNGYDVHRHASPEPLAGYAHRVVIPDGFTETALRGEKSVITFERTGAGLARDYDEFRIGRAVYTVLADLLVCAGQDRAPDAAAFDELQQAPRSVALDVRQAGKRKEIPTGFEHAVPGVMIMFSMIVVLSSASSALVIERERGLLKRLASAPITRGEIFTGKWIAWLAIGYLQVIVGLVAGTVLFDLDWGPDLPTILLVLLVWSALCASLGLLLGNLVRSEAQGIGASVLGANVLCALGGQWWPIEIMPDWMQKLAMFLPTGWTMDALHQLSLFRAGASVAIPYVVALLVTAAIVGIVGARTFRFQ